MSAETQALSNKGPENGASNSARKRSSSVRRPRKSQLQKTHSLGGMNKFGAAGPPLTRRHTTQNTGALRSRSRSKRRSSSRNRETAPSTNVEKEKSSSGRVSVRRSSSSTLRGYRRSNSVGSDTGGVAEVNTDIGGDIWQKRLGTASSAASLYQKLSKDEQARAHCPLPSISSSMGDATIATEAGVTSESVVPSVANVEGGMDDTKHDNCQEKQAKTQGFYQFDPFKTNNVNLVQTDSQDVSIFSMAEKSETEQSQDSEKDNTKLKGFYQFDPSKKDNVNLVHATSEDDSIFPMKEKSQSRSSRLGEHLKEMENSCEMPALIDDTLTQAEDINSLFGGTWAGAITLTSDNALGHFEDKVDDPKNPSDQTTSTETNKDKVEDIAEEDSNESASSRDSEEETVSGPEGDRDFNATQALLQFNHKTPDGLDFAACDTDDTSIFRMDSDATLEIPSFLTTDLAESDKQILQASKSVAKEKRNSLFTSTILKARSFKRPRASVLVEKALITAESFITPTAKVQPVPVTTDRADAPANRNQKFAEASQREQKSTNEKKGQPAKSVVAGEQSRRGRSKSQDCKSDAEAKDDTMDGSAQSSGSNKRGRTKRRKSDKSLKMGIDRGSNDMDRSTTRKRRERVKGKRESNREKASEQDEDRKERQRKRESMRKAASARSVSNHQSPVVSPGTSPKKRGSTKPRRSVGNAIPSNAIPKIAMDNDDSGGNHEEEEEKPTPPPENKESNGISRRRSNSRKPRRNGLPRRNGSTSTSKKSLRRASSNEASVATSTRLRSSSGNRVRASGGTPQRRHSSARSRRGRDSGKVELDGSLKDDDRSGRPRRDRERDDSELDGSSKQNGGELDGSAKRNGRRRSSDRKRRSRKAKENEGKDDAMEKDASNNTSKERRQNDRKQGRKSRKSREGAGDRMDKGSSRIENSPQSVQSASKYEITRATAVLNNSLTLVFDPEEEGVDGKASSLRLERSLDTSFPALMDLQDSMSEPFFHNDLGNGDSDRRENFIKSLSVKIGAKQSSFGKGARKMIVGGSRTEK